MMQYELTNRLPVAIGSAVRFTAIVGSATRFTAIIGSATRFTLIFLLIALASTACLAADEPLGPLQQKGKLDKLRNTTSKLARLGWQNGRLVMPRSDDADKIEKAFDAIKSLTGNNSGSSSSGGDERSWSFNGGTMKGELNLSKLSSILPFFSRKGWQKMELTLQENTGPRRLLRLYDDGKKGLVVSLVGDRDQHFLRMRQRHDGTMLVQELNGDHTFVAQGKTFLGLYKRHRTYVEDRLIPIFRHVGVKPPPLAADPRVQATALALLIPVDEALQAEFKEILQRLVSPEFKEREKASGELTSGFKRYKPLLRLAINGKQLVPEAENRIRRILKAKTDPEARSIDQLVASLELDRDAGYLIWLLEMESAKKPVNAKGIESLSGRLKQLTKQDLGADIAAWKSWLEKQPKPVRSDSVATVVTAPLQEKGPLQKTTVAMQKLIALSISDGRLLLDREHWRRQFGGKTIAELDKEVKAEIKKRGLPQSWYRPYYFWRTPVRIAPHALFENLFELVDDDDHPHGFNSSVRGRGWDSSLTLEGGNISGKMILKSKGRKKPSVRLSFQELSGPRRTLRVADDGKGKMVLIVISDSSDYVMQFTQQADGKCRLQRLSGVDALNVKAESFPQLVTQHGKFIQGELVPLLRHFGLTVTLETVTLEKTSKSAERENQPKKK